MPDTLHVICLTPSPDASAPVLTALGALPGFTVTARIEFDPDARPEDRGFDPDEGSLTDDERCQNREILASWERDEWFYCGVVLSVSRCGVDLTGDVFFASLWGIECNLPARFTTAPAGNDYLLEVANELLPEALAEARRVLDRLCGCEAAP